MHRRAEHQGRRLAIRQLQPGLHPVRQTPPRGRRERLAIRRLPMHICPRPSVIRRAASNRGERNIPFREPPFWYQQVYLAGAGGVKSELSSVESVGRSGGRLFFLGQSSRLANSLAFALRGRVPEVVTSGFG